MKLAVGAAALMFACGNDWVGIGSDAIQSDALAAVDLRVPVPAPDPNAIDVISPDLIIQPGEEKMYCLHARNDQGDVAVDDFIGRQAPIGGHHIALYTTTDPKPPGTLEDCTSPAANAKLHWFVITGSLQPGYAIHLPANASFVMQFHYINATEQPILIRDVGRILKVDPATVTHWVSTFVMQDVALALPPGPTTVSWECAVSQPLTLVYLFGHMHEHGASYRIDVGSSPVLLSNIYTVDPWRPELRDAPPSLSFYDQPLALAAGSMMRTTCNFENASATSITYPAEMCLTFAYVTGGDGPYQCPSP
jgi:hypothetical protein